MRPRRSLRSKQVRPELDLSAGLLERSESFADGVLGQLGHRSEPQLVHDLTPVGFDRRRSDVEADGDVFRGLSLGEQLEHFSFARREWSR